MSEPSHPPGSGDPPDGGARGAPGDGLDPEIAELARKAAESEDPVAKLLLPLPSDAVDRIVGRALGPAQGPARGAKVIAFPRRGGWPRWAAFAAAAALVMAAAVAVFLLVGRPGTPQRTAYLLELKGDSSQRGDEPAPEGPVTLRPSTRLRVRLAPSIPVRDKLLRVLVVRDGRARLLPEAPHSTAADGAIVIDAPALAALGEQQNGPAELVFVVGRQIPGDDEVQRLVEDRSVEPGADFAVLRRAVVFEGWGRASLDPGDIEFGGCDAVTSGPACEVAPGARLRFWAPLTGEEVALQVDGRPVSAARESVQGGTRLTLEAPPGAASVEVVGPAGQVVLRLPLRPALDVTALKEARALMQKNQLDDAEERLSEAEKGGGPAPKLQALRLRARVARRRGDRPRMKALLRRAIADDHAAGRLSDETEDRHLHAYHHMIREIDFAAARDDLTRTLPLEAQCPEYRADGDYHRALLAGETGQFEEQLRLLYRARDLSRRLLLGEMETVSRAQLLDALALLGRHGEAQALVEESLADAGASADPCLSTRLVTTAAWALLRGASSPGAIEKAERSAAEAVETARSRCPSDLPNALLNLGFAELSAHEIAGARAHLAEARRAAGKDDVRFLSWSEALELELDLSGRPEDALEAFEALRKRGEDKLSPELLFRAASGRARALALLDRTEDARAAFGEADGVLDRWSALVPFGEGRESFFIEQGRWARAAVDFHVRLAEAAAPGSPAREGAVRGAAAVAQRGLARFFDVAAGSARAADSEQAEYRKSRVAADQGLALKKALAEAPGAALKEAQERSWGRAQAKRPDDRRPAEGGALTLTYHPVADGWVGFAVGSDGRATMARLPSFKDEMLAAEEQGAAGGRPPAPGLAGLLTPFGEQIERASVVRVPGHGPLRRVRFEALPWKSGVLSDAVTVAYGFDGAGAAAPAKAAEPPCSGPPRALLVTNPDEDLAGAEAGGPAVREALAARGWEVVWLEGAAAKRAAILAALTDPCTALFHYDGHARFHGAGIDSLGAALSLRDAPLTVQDILDLPRVPRTAVLMGCVTARDDGMGLAQALLFRGAREVLASTHAVDDGLSRRVSERLYDAAPRASEGPPALAPALRAATGPLHAGGAAAVPWWFFRVIAR